MTTFATVCLFVLLGCMAVCLFRLVRGPRMFDRLLAFDLIGVLTAALIAAYSIIRESWIYLEISMGLAVLSLVGTVAVAHLITRERVF
jgi:multisubunit Na+/H+ antiporter MnhF subunit